MPRYYRKRYTRVVKPKKKWATNLVDVDVSQSTGGVGTGKVYMVKSLCGNSSATSTPTPIIVKTGNFKLQFDATFGLTNGAPLQFSAYIIYIPEGSLGTVGYDDLKNLIDRHPEWVLAWKFGSYDFVSNAATGNIDSIRVSSRLKRNLNSGDSIYFFGLATSTQNITTAGGHGMCQFWTCAN